ncbi:hypothetical protein EBN03_31670 [Nocardia stercoris]|uniref:Uncharacterized protein n=1 Tax=Nocardia stercoris TaxID=2483361 RepID=A0A3M2KQV1_9NOCA|nr:hypothetical protein EBN03_31670 [Nocardia stercoris]
MQIVPSGIAFQSPSGKIKCIALAGLLCGVDLQKPPPDPQEQSRLPWQANVVEAVNSKVEIGEYSGSPAPWEVDGPGNRLPYGSTVTTRNGPTCRMDQVGLYCLNPDAKSAYRISDVGVVPFGCLAPSVTGREAWHC